MNKKKSLYIIIGTILIIIMTACDKTGTAVTQTPAVNVSPTPIPKDEPIVTSSESTDGIDVDLTVLSSTLVYSEVYNMMTAPEEYIGKTIRISGSFQTFINEDDGRYIYGCVITDATACCAQGIEFELTDDYKYPDDYPKDGDMICVTGTFDTYQEQQLTYCTLRNASLESASLLH